MSERVPGGWRIIPLGAATEVVNGRAYKLTEWEDFGTPVIRLQNLTQKGGSFYFSNLELPEKQFCHKGDLLFMWSASFGPYIWWGDKAIFHYHIWKMVPESELLNRKFLYFYLLQKTEEWKINTSGMAMQHLTKSGIEAQEVILPPLPEQKKIASILTSVDEVIETTQKQIDKLQDLKKATMNELLTKGIGHTEFKDSELVPKGWLQFPLSELSEKITDGSHYSPPTVFSNFRIATVENMKETYIEISDCRTISEEEFIKLSSNSCKPQAEDVLFSKDGTIGKTLVYKQLDEIVLLSSIAIIRVKQSKLNPYFLEQYLSSPLFFEELENRKSGSAIRRVVLGDLKSIPVPLPPRAEQKKIASILTSVDEQITLRNHKLSQTQSLKKSLMQDLLTGKVRVQVN